MVIVDTSAPSASTPGMLIDTGSPAWGSGGGAAAFGSPGAGRPPRPPRGIDRVRFYAQQLQLPEWMTAVPADLNGAHAGAGASEGWLVLPRPQGAEVLAGVGAWRRRRRRASCSAAVHGARSGPSARAALLATDAPARHPAPSSSQHARLHRACPHPPPRHALPRRRQPRPHNGVRRARLPPAHLPLPPARRITRNGCARRKAACRGRRWWRRRRRGAQRHGPGLRLPRAEQVRVVRLACTLLEGEARWAARGTRGGGAVECKMLPPSASSRVMM